MICFFLFFNDTATTEIYTLSLHDALPIYVPRNFARPTSEEEIVALVKGASGIRFFGSGHSFNDGVVEGETLVSDRKSTRLNSSHANISYAVFCLKKKKNTLLSIIHSMQSR